MEEKWEIVSEYNTKISLDSFWHVMGQWTLYPEHWLDGVRRYRLIEKLTFKQEKPFQRILWEHIDKKPKSEEKPNPTENSKFSEISITYNPSTALNLYSTESSAIYIRELKASDNAKNKENNQKKIQSNSVKLGSSDILNSGDAFFFKQKVMIDRVFHFYEENRIVFAPDYLDGLSYFYPKVQRFAFEYVIDPSSSGVKIVAKAVYLPDVEFRPVMKKICDRYLSMIDKWGKNKESGYEKRVNHDVIVPRNSFIKKYDTLKQKYKDWASDWQEKSDPSKFVFEDIAIASFLICLWENERKLNPSLRKQKFLDLGCGNGFLVYLLTSEGYQGKGYDLQKRKIWERYPSFVRLEQIAILPQEMTIDAEECDWLLGNHSDELTPWIPFLAGNSEHLKFFLLPCCFWDFDSKFSRFDVRIGRYKSYLNWIGEICEKCGFNVEWETLRIPSSKNVSLIGRSRNYDFSRKDAAHESRMGLIRHVSNFTVKKLPDPKIGHLKGERQKPFKPKKEDRCRKVGSDSKEIVKRDSTE